MRSVLIMAVIASAFFIAAAPANAISRYNSMSLSCGAIHGILDRQKAAIFRYPSKHVRGLTLYDRYVRSEFYCLPHQISERVIIPSKTGSCPVLHCIMEPDICDTFIGGHC